jgi:hypothetical protein
MLSYLLPRIARDVKPVIELSGPLDHASSMPALIRPPMRMVGKLWTCYSRRIEGELALARRHRNPGTARTAPKPGATPPQRPLPPQRSQLLTFFLSVSAVIISSSGFRTAQVFAHRIACGVLGDGARRSLGAAPAVRKPATMAAQEASVCRRFMPAGTPYISTNLGGLRRYPCGARRAACVPHRWRIDRA